MLITGRACSHHTKTLADRVRTAVQQGEEQFKLVKQQLQRATAQAVKRLTAKIAAFQQQLDSSQQSDATRKRADMLMANVHRSNANAGQCPLLSRFSSCCLQPRSHQL